MSDDIATILEGSWKGVIGNTAFSLYLPGPNTGNGCYQLGEHFSLSSSKTHEDGSGVSDHITGIFSIADMQLTLTCRTIMVEGWGPADEEVIDEEPCVNEYEGDDLVGVLDLSGDEPIIRMTAFNQQIEFRKA